MKRSGRAATKFANTGETQSVTPPPSCQTRVESNAIVLPTAGPDNILKPASPELDDSKLPDSGTPVPHGALLLCAHAPTLKPMTVAMKSLLCREFILAIRLLFKYPALGTC